MPGKPKYAHVHSATTIRTWDDIMRLRGKRITVIDLRGSKCLKDTWCAHGRFSGGERCLCYEKVLGAALRAHARTLRLVIVPPAYRVDWRYVNAFAPSSVCHAVRRGMAFLLRPLQRRVDKCKRFARTFVVAK
jgi:hypothetical protein